MIYKICCDYKYFVNTICKKKPKYDLILTS